MEDALVVQGHLFERIEEAREPRSGIILAQDLLVTLHRLKLGDEMVRVADLSLANFGPISSFEYQAVLGHMTCGDSRAAWERLSRIFPHLQQNDPLFPKFSQMKQILERQ